MPEEIAELVGKPKLPAVAEAAKVKAPKKLKARTAKLGIAGAAVVAAPIVYDAVTGEGSAQASELKPDNFNQPEKAPEHSDVSIGVLDAE